jgi:hypothetical protein
MRDVIVSMLIILTIVPVIPVCLWHISKGLWEEVRRWL